MKSKEDWKDILRNITIIEYQYLLKAMQEVNQETADSMMVDEL